MSKRPNVLLFLVDELRYPTEEVAVRSTHNQRQPTQFRRCVRASRIARMGRLLEKVIEETAKLPEPEQEAFAAFMLAELESERRWDELFARSQGMLARMAEEARQEYRSGRTEALDLDKL